MAFLCAGSNHTLRCDQWHGVPGQVGERAWQTLFNVESAWGPCCGWYNSDLLDGVFLAAEKQPAAYARLLLPAGHLHHTLLARIMCPCRHYVLSCKLCWIFPHSLFVTRWKPSVSSQSSRKASIHCRLHHFSLLLFNKVTQPAMDWILQQYAAPAYSNAAVAAWQQVLSAVFTLLWLLPLYLISLMVSCIW